MACSPSPPMSVSGCSYITGPVLGCIYAKLITEVCNAEVLVTIQCHMVRDVSYSNLYVTQRFLRGLWLSLVLELWVRVRVKVRLEMSRVRNAMDTKRLGYEMSGSPVPLSQPQTVTAIRPVP